MVLYLIGLGLGDEDDITVKGLKAVQKCSRVYLEHYTSILGAPLERLEEVYGCKITLADRDMVETQSDEMLAHADEEDVAILVVGDPFAATTHGDLFVRAAKDKNIKVEVIHNASIMNAIGACGASLYNFGQTISIPYFEDNWRPQSFYDKLKVNAALGFHTLCLLDIKVKERSLASLLAGTDDFMPPRFMSVNEALSQLMEIEEARGEGILSETTMCVGLARVGQHDQKIVYGKLADVSKVDFGAPLHSLIILGTTHPIEEEVLDYFGVSE